MRFNMVLISCRDGWYGQALAQFTLRTASTAGAGAGPCAEGWFAAAISPMVPPPTGGRNARIFRFDERMHLMRREASFPSRAREEAVHTHRGVRSLIPARRDGSDQAIAVPDRFLTR